MGPALRAPLGSRASARGTRSALVFANASGGSDSRVRFQYSREATTSRQISKKTFSSPPTAPARRQTPVVTELAEPLDSLPDAVFEEALAPLPRRNVARTVRAVILAGGETKNPLTRWRALPSVPIGSALRLVDIPINNCMRAGVNKIYVLTQFQSHALNSHIAASYPPVRFSGREGAGWVDVLAAQQTVTEKSWYLGSADAIRKNIGELKDEARGVHPASDYIILSGAGIYTLDMGRALAYHRARNADVTMITHLVDAAAAPTKGIVTVAPATGQVLKFAERPRHEALFGLRHHVPDASGAPQYLASMGAYIFSREALFALLDDPARASNITHIGHHLIPGALAQGMRVHGFQYNGYWRDVSTLRDYFDANLELAMDDSGIQQFEVEDGVAAAKGRMLPPALMQGKVSVKASLVDDGAVLVDCAVHHSVVGPNVYIGSGSRLERCLLLGSPGWTNETIRAAAEAAGERVYGVGANCELRNCIVDKNASIGDGVKILNAENVQEADRADTDGYMIQDGIVVVMRGAKIPAGTVI